MHQIDHFARMVRIPTARNSPQKPMISDHRRWPRSHIPPRRCQRRCGVGGPRPLPSATFTSPLGGQSRMDLNAWPWTPNKRRAQRSANEIINLRTRADRIKSANPAPLTASSHKTPLDTHCRAQTEFYHHRLGRRLDMRGARKSIALSHGETFLFVGDVGRPVFARNGRRATRGSMRPAAEKVGSLPWRERLCPPRQFVQNSFPPQRTECRP